MKTIVFDFDGTLTKRSYEIWTKMWEAVDALDVDYKLYKQYKNKEIDYIKWCELIEEEYIKRGFDKNLLYKLADKIELMDNLKETLETLKNKGYKLYIVSGGVKEVILYKLGDLSSYFDGIYACEFVFDKDNRLINIIPTKYDEEGKKIFIDEYCSLTKTSPEEITFIGNGDNDEYVYLSGCATICLNPTKFARYTNQNIWHKVILDVEDMKVILDFFK